MAVRAEAPAFSPIDTKGLGRSLAMHIRMSQPEFREHIRILGKKRMTPKFREMLAEKARARWKRQEYRERWAKGAKRRKNSMRGKQLTESHKKKLSLAQENAWKKDPLRRIRAREVMIGRTNSLGVKRSEETKRKIGEATKLKWQDENFRSKFVGKKRSETDKRKISRGLIWRHAKTVGLKNLVHLNYLSSPDMQTITDFMQGGQKDPETSELLILFKKLKGAISEQRSRSRTFKLAS